MTPKDKKNGSKLKKTIIGISTLLVAISIIGAFFTNEQKKKGDLQEYKQGQKEVTFDDSKQKNDVVNLLTVDIHPFRLGEAQKEIGVSQTEIKDHLVEVDSLITTTLNQKIIDAEYTRVQDSTENVRAIEIQKLREKKYLLQKDIWDELILIKEAQRKTNERFDGLENQNN